jgi:hypothetical protein
MYCMKLRMGKHDLEMNSAYLTELKCSNDILDNPEKLRQRMQEEGYLLIRDFHNREQVLAARRNVLDKLHEMGRLSPNHPIEDGVVGTENRGAFFGGAGADFVADFPNLIEVVNSSQLMTFFDSFLEGASTTYEYKWPRAVGTNGFTGAHYDIVYMGRGTKNLYTTWTPLSDIPLEHGPLAVCLGSHKFDKIKETYGNMDVDRDNISNGWFTNDPIEVVEKYGGQWATTSFNAGDIIIFGMFTLHGSLNNSTNRFRMSVDTRYQLSSEPMDDRWVGKTPKGHSAQTNIEKITMEQARQKWGV